MDNKRLLVIVKVCFILFCINVSAAILVGCAQAFPGLFTIHMMDIIRWHGTTVVIPMLPLLLAGLMIAMFLLIATAVFNRILYGRRRTRQGTEE